MKSKLGIDFDKVGHAREMARKIADQVQDFVDGYTTVAVERTLCRLLGIDGVDVHAVPLPNILVDERKEKNVRKCTDHGNIQFQESEGAGG